MSTQIDPNLEAKKMVNIFLRLNLSLVTVSNDKFFFFKMTSEFLFQEYI